VKSIPIKDFLIDSLLTPIVESIYLTILMSWESHGMGSHKLQLH